MDFTLTTEQQGLMEKAEWVARKCLEPRAAQYDREGSHPLESWHDLWEHGLLAITVPKEYGGLGVDMLTYAIVIERLAWGCVSTALSFNMHAVVQRFIDALAAPEQKAWLYADVVEKGKLYASWGSEPVGRGGSGTRDTIVSRTADGYVVNGDKHFCTMAGAAHRGMVHCTMEGYKGVEGYQMVLVPHDAPGLQVIGEWDTLGARGTVSPAVSFRNCLVAEDTLLGKPGQVGKTGIGSGFGIGYAATYLGAAQRALDFTIEYCNTHQFAPEPAPLSHNLLVQRNTAEMSMAIQAARLVLWQSASQWEEANATSRWPVAARAKYLATEAALMVTSKALQTVGGRSVHKDYPLERLYRDVRTSTLMPPNADRSLQLVGQAEMGIEDALIRASFAS